MDKATKAAVPGMAVQALAGEIIDALLKDEKDGGYDLTAGLFGGEFSTLVRRWAEAEWSSQTAPKDLYPSFDHIGQLKLDDLKARGYSITGYAIEKPGAGPHPERGFVTAGGFVGWWRSDEQAAVVCKSEQKRLATLWGFVPQGASDQALAEVIKERDDAEEFGDKLLDLVLGSDRPEWSSAYGSDDALLQVEEKMAALERAQAAPAALEVKDDYRAWYIEAMEASNEAGFVGLSAADTIRALAATPALPATEDSSAGDLAAVQAEPVVTSVGWREQFSQAVYADLAAADNQDVPLEDYPGRILKVLDSIVGPHHPTVVHWRNDAIRACIEIVKRYGAGTTAYQERDMAALYTAPQAQPADALDADTPYQRGYRHGYNQRDAEVQGALL